jgi:hypothetical protein
LSETNFDCRAIARNPGRARSPSFDLDQLRRLVSAWFQTSEK